MIIEQEDMYKDPFEDLFKFPILQVDGRNEELKEKNLTDEEVDLILCKAELPFWDFLCIKDGWPPNEKGFIQAIAGKFDCSTVTFRESGTYICPWSVTRFKKEMRDFIATLKEKEKDKPVLITIDLKKIEEEIIKKQNETKE